MTQGDGYESQYSQYTQYKQYIQYSRCFGNTFNTKQYISGFLYCAPDSKLYQAFKSHSGQILYWMYQYTIRVRELVNKRKKEKDQKKERKSPYALL